MITITALKWAPDVVRGLVRDLRVRWALEEAGLPYRENLIGPEDQASVDYRGWQPFGQVPAFEEDGLSLFESGAIVLYVGARSPALMPPDDAGRARATTWVFAAINSIEPFLLQLFEIDVVGAGQEWAKVRRPDVERFVKRRLGELAARLGERDYLEGRFTVGDLMMTSVLRILRHTDLVAAEPRCVCVCVPRIRRAARRGRRSSAR